MTTEREKKREYTRRWRDENRERYNETIRKWRAENHERYKEIQRAGYARNKEDRQRRQKAAREANLEKARSEHMRRHRHRTETDPGYVVARRLCGRVTRARRRAVEAANLSKLFADEIALIYDNCVPGYEVDHIHPLLGKNFSGLHVPWNMQYLTATENKRKGNRLVVS
jgi:ATPase subunit of ABC transporter with duplicated ATPase domains